MKRKLTLLAAIPMLLMGFSSCSHDDDPIVPADGQEIRVAFTTDAIQTRVNTLATGDVWDNGDQIKIEKTVGYDDTDYCTYTASVDEKYGTTTWTSDRKLYWEGEEVHILKAFYPTVGQDSYYKFKLPLYQDTEERLKSADCMNAIWVGSPTTNEIKLQMKHRLSMVTVNYELASEFTGASISLAIVEAANIDVYFDFTSEGALEILGIDFDGPADIWAYNNTVDKTIQAIVLPCTYPKGQLFMTIIINEERLQVKMPENMTFEEGTHYTFNLKVGKDIVTLEQTNVGNDIPGWDNYPEDELN